MWGGVLFAIVAAVLTGPVLHVAVIHWVAAIAWTVAGAALAAETTFLATRALARQVDVLKVRRVARQILVAEVIYITGVATVTGGLNGGGCVMLILVPLFTGLVLSRRQTPFFAVGMAGAVFLVGFLSHTWVTANYAMGTVALVTIPVMTLVSGQLATTVLDQEQRAHDNRRELEAQVGELSDALVRASEGDLSVYAPTADEGGESNVAISSLSASFNNTIANLRLLVEQIRGGGDQLSQSAGELLATAEEHAASATQQSSAVAETTSTIEELAATAAQIADTAESVARYAAETLRYAEDGRVAVDGVGERHGLDRRPGRLDRDPRPVARREEPGDRPHPRGHRRPRRPDEPAGAQRRDRGGACRRARPRLRRRRRRGPQAGRAGPGVDRADPERSWPRSSPRPTRPSSPARRATRRSTTASELARDVVDALERISGMVDETTTAAKEISIATQQQRSASDQVVSAMTQVSDVSRQYVVGSKQSAAAAAQLNDLAAELRVVHRAVPSVLTPSPRTSHSPQTLSPGRSRTVSGWTDDPELVAIFRAEVDERLASLRDGLLRLEDHPAPKQLIAVLFRDAHTVKGSARALALDERGRASRTGPRTCSARCATGASPVRRDLVDLLLGRQRGDRPCDARSRAARVAPKTSPPSWSRSTRRWAATTRSRCPSCPHPCRRSTPRTWPTPPTPTGVGARPSASRPAASTTCSTSSARPSSRPGAWSARPAAWRPSPPST